MKKAIGNILIAIYAIIAIIVTVLLLSYNDYKCSVIGGKTLYIANYDVENTYQKGDLLVIENSRAEDIKVGDEIYLYKNLSNYEYEVVSIKVSDITNQGNRIVFVAEGNISYDGSYLIGKTNGTNIYHNLGTVLGILESRLGYLFCVVIVTMLLFLNEIYQLFIEIKYGDEVTE